MKHIINSGIFILNLIYNLFKLLPTQNKITYISRQLNETPLDFKLTIDNYKTKDSNTKHVVLAKRIPNSLLGKIGYCFHIFTQMYHIATSKIVCLDTYCIPISILNHKDDLIVIQMWHALGSVKKFGYSILNQKEGSSKKVAELMRMHRNYDVVLASSPFAANNFAQAFDVDLDKIKIYPLPKTDELLNEDRKKLIINKIYEIYPNLNNSKKKIVYVPTFRKGNNHLDEAIRNFINIIDYSKYDLIIKPHPLSNIHIESNALFDDKFSSNDMMLIADIIVTDYSAIMVEASILNKPIYFYAFDYSTYAVERDFYIDYLKDIPGKIYEDVNELYNAIECNDISIDEIERFSNLMLSKPKVSYTDDFVDYLLTLKK